MSKEAVRGEWGARFARCDPKVICIGEPGDLILTGTPDGVGDVRAA